MPELLAGDQIPNQHQDLRHDVRDDAGAFEAPDERRPEGGNREGEPEAAFLELTKAHTLSLLHGKPDGHDEDGAGGQDGDRIASIAHNAVAWGCPVGGE